jgi:hypothetical protein
MDAFNLPPTQRGMADPRAANARTPGTGGGGGDPPEQRPTKLASGRPQEPVVSRTAMTVLEKDLDKDKSGPRRDSSPVVVSARRPPGTETNMALLDSQSTNKGSRVLYVAAGVAALVLAAGGYWIATAGSRKPVDAAQTQVASKPAPQTTATTDQAATSESPMTPSTGANPTVGLAPTTASATTSAAPEVSSTPTTAPTTKVGAAPTAQKTATAAAPTASAKPAVGDSVLIDRN